MPPLAPVTRATRPASSVIGMMEGNAAILVQPQLPAGKASAGTRGLRACLGARRLAPRPDRRVGNNAGRAGVRERGRERWRGAAGEKVRAVARATRSHIAM